MEILLFLLLFAAGIIRFIFWAALQLGLIWLIYKLAILLDISFWLLAIFIIILLILI